MPDKHQIQALNLAGNGKCGAAHRLIQGHSDERSCLIHGYLHRVQGELGNPG